MLAPLGFTLAPGDSQRGTSLAELMVALVMLSVGILAIAQLFPAGARGQVRDHMATVGGYYAQQQLEVLNGVPWSDPGLTVGRHPAGAATEDLGTTKMWHRHYDVELMSAPLDDLKKVTVTVEWFFLGTRSVQAITYLRR